jgi:hypothetical protein
MTQVHHRRFRKSVECGQRTSITTNILTNQDSALRLRLVVEIRDRVAVRCCDQSSHITYSISYNALGGNAKGEAKGQGAASERLYESMVITLIFIGICDDVHEVFSLDGAACRRCEASTLCCRMPYAMDPGLHVAADHLLMLRGNDARGQCDWAVKWRYA